MDKDKLHNMKNDIYTVLDSIKVSRAIIELSSDHKGKRASLSSLALAQKIVGRVYIDYVDLLKGGQDD